MNRYDLKINHALISELIKGYVCNNRLTLRDASSHFDFSYTVIKRLADGDATRIPGLRIIAILSDKFNRPLTDFYELILNKNPVCTLKSRYELLLLSYENLRDHTNKLEKEKVLLMSELNIKQV